MVTVFFLLATALAAWWVLTHPSLVPGPRMPIFMQQLAGVAIIGFSGLLAMRGRFNLAVPVFLYGLGLIAKGGTFAGFGFPGAEKGKKSRVATAVLNMELDHDSGTMDGEVLMGPLLGRRLSSLSPDDMQALHRLCVDANDQSQALFEAWLDRARPDWRDSFGAGQGRAASGGAMTVDDAYAVLGLKKGASKDDIRAAHRRLMKQVHPDAGGSDYLAAKINEAKDLLLSV